MNIKNVFKSMLLTAALLAGATGAKAIDLRTVSQGGGRYIIPGDQFASAVKGSKMRCHVKATSFFYWEITYTIRNGFVSPNFNNFSGERWGNEWAVRYDASRIREGYAEVEFSAATAANAQAYGMNITFTGLSLSRVELISGGTTPPTQKMETIAISDAGYATFCSTQPLDFSRATGLTAFYAKEVADGVVYFSPVTGVVAAGTALLIKGTSGSVPVAEEGAMAESLSDNLLVGVTEGTVTVNAANQYVLVKDKDGVLKFAGTAAKAASVGAGKVYLQTAAVGARIRMLALHFNDGQTTEVAPLHTAAPATSEVFDLQGRRQSSSNLKKGIYIINGRKTVVR